MRLGFVFVFNNVVNNIENFAPDTTNLIPDHLYLVYYNSKKG